jgi:hypothetical protein
MTLTVDLVLLILAAVCFGLAAFGVAFRSVSFVALGLLLWVLTLLL